MMKRTMGSLGLYSDGLAPSMTPPCDGARSPVGVSSAAAEVSVERIALVVVAMVPWLRKVSCRWGRTEPRERSGSKRVESEEEGGSGEVIKWVWSVDRTWVLGVLGVVGGGRVTRVRRWWVMQRCGGAWPLGCWGEQGS